MEQVGYKVSYINALTLFHFSKKSGTDVEQVEQMWNEMWNKWNKISPIFDRSGTKKEGIRNGCLQSFIS